MGNAVKKEAENQKRFSRNRFEAVMIHSKTKWEDLKEEFGNDIQQKVVSGNITEGELYDVCMYMHADYRYALMLKDDYEIDVLHDPIPDPRGKIIKLGSAGTVNKTSSAKQAPKKSASAKTKTTPKNSEKEIKEKNWVRKERVSELMEAGGISFAVVKDFLGTSAPCLRQYLETKSLVAGTTSNLSWLLETTEGYITGKHGSPREGSKDQSRKIMSNQTFLLNSEVLATKRPELKNSGMFPDELILWMTTQDRLVTEKFAERIAKVTGLHVSKIRARSKYSYESEPSLVGTMMKLQDIEARDKKRDSETKKESDVRTRNIPVSDDAAQTVPESKESCVAETAKAEKSEACSDSGKPEKSLKEIRQEIDGLSDSDLEKIAKYAQALLTVRTII